MSRPIASESVFRAIADPTRRRIMDLLRARESSPGDLNQSLQIAGGVLTFHLRVLAHAGLISQRRRGRQRFYRLHPTLLSPIGQWLRAHEPRSDRVGAKVTPGLNKS